MEQLKRLRAKKGLSQARLAARAELDPSTVNQIERGAREASPNTLRKLADALEVSLYDLLEEEAPKAQAPLPLGDEQRHSLQEALSSYMERRTKSLEAELKDEISPHFESATAATVWVAGVQQEAKDWADWATEEWSVLMPQEGGLFDRDTWRAVVNILGHLMTFHAITQRAERRIAEMADRPDELAQKRLEKNRREAQESERKLQELQAASG